MSKLQKGYNIVFTHWENDGDNYKTTVVNCTEPKEVELLVPFLKILKGPLGNLGEGELEQVDRSDLVKLLPSLCSWKWGELELDEYFDEIDALREFLYDMDLASEYSDTRKVESIEVYFVSQIENMTGDFV